MMCKLHNIEQIIDYNLVKMFGHLATHLQCDQVVCPGSHRVHLIHGRRGIVTIHADCCLHTSVQPSCTITTISPSLLDFYNSYIKRPSTACIAPRCDAPAGVQHYSGFSHNEVPSVVSTSSCRPIVSPPPPPTFPNQSEPLVPGVRVQDPIHYTVYRAAVTAPDAVHSLSLRS